MYYWDLKRIVFTKTTLLYRQGVAKKCGTTNDMHNY